MEQKNIRKEDALYYHAKGRPGKIEVIPTKETNTPRDLSLAYSPGVAEPCLEIAANWEDVYKYTAKGNLVAVISNGTAVLGLGDIGPEASKPVMEGKGVLFKIYADIDVFDIEIDAKGIDEFVNTVKAISPTFGGINLEDIKAPECFEIEKRLRKELNIPVMHDDQHGTAIISGAALLNALEVVNKNIEDVRFVVSGAGASAITCAQMYLLLGAKAENMVMFDRTGIIHSSREDMAETKALFATSLYPPETTLAEAMKGADVFLGLSKGNILSQDMVRSMANSPIVFAMANPDPEITYEAATSARADVIMATGRSDYPNQVNNVLGFPYIFRGALDVRATDINEAMKRAAVYSIAELAKKPVPDSVAMVYSDNRLTFGPTYIIPKPMDPRLLTTVAPAVARAAMESGIARHPIQDWEAYEQELARRGGYDNQVTRVLINKAKRHPCRVVFADAEDPRVLKAAQQVRDEQIAFPILLGNESLIRNLMETFHIDLTDVPIIDPKSLDTEATCTAFGEHLYAKRQRKGMSKTKSLKNMSHRNYFGAMMVEMEQADAVISGITRNYPDTIRPALQVIGTKAGVKKVAGMYIVMTKQGPIFLSDTTVNFNPTVEEIVEITELTAQAVRKFNIEPRIALVNYSNFGNAAGEDAVKMNRAVAILQEKYPDLIVDGEMQAHLAFDTELLRKNHPFCKLADGPANTLIFPNLSSSNIAYNLLKAVAGVEAVGPILLGLRKPVHVLQMGSSEREIVNMVAYAVVEHAGV
ncbi:MAG: NADP-dependent malic enzyme [Saprospiraceae bacterium]